MIQWLISIVRLLCLGLAIPIITPKPLLLQQTMPIKELPLVTRIMKLLKMAGLLGARKQESLTNIGLIVYDKNC